MEIYRDENRSLNEALAASVKLCRSRRIFSEVTILMRKMRSNFKGRTLALFMAVLLLPLGITVFAWDITAENAFEAKKAKFQTLVVENERALFNLMQSYNFALLGGKGFYEGSSIVTRDDWKAYVNATDILKNFPGINGIGTIYDVGREDLEAFEQQAAADGFPGFKVKPEGIHPENFIINYIEPVEINTPAVGLNIGFEAHRREAAIKARDTGKSTITKRILLVQDAEKTPGFLLLHPTYERGLPLDSVEARREAFVRWIYAPFIAKNFMRNLTDSQGKTLHLRVYDGTAEDPDTLIYNSNPDSPQTKPEFSLKKNIEIMQQEWLLVWLSTPEFESSENNNEPFLVFLSGLLFTGLLAVFVIVMRIGSYSEQSVTLKSYLVPLAAFAITATGGFLLHQEVSRKERSFIANSTREASESISFAITKNVDSRILALSRMANRWNARGGIPFSEWQQDAENYVADQPGLKAVEWVDKTYHVKWAEPLAGNENAIGLNVLFNEEREKALKGAALKDTATITPPLDLVQGYKAFISYSPLRANGGFDGFIVGIFGISELIENVLTRENQSNFVIRLSHEDQLFYSSGQAEGSGFEDWVASRTLRISDKEWKLEVLPTPTFIREHTNYLPDLILAVGLILALMVGLIINFAQRSRQKTLLVQEKENLLSTFVKHTPAAVAMFDNKLNYVAASDRWYKDYRLPDDDIIGKNHYDIFPEIREKHPEWQESYQRAINGEIIKSEEQPFFRQDGRTEWLRYELRPWQKNSNEPGGLIMFSEDITERKKMEVMKDEFVSTVNHELRTPLTSIKGSLGLLKMKAEKTLDANGRRLLELSYENCNHLSHLVNDILDIEKIAAGKMDYHIEVVELNELVEEIVDRNQSFARKYKVKFVIKPGGEKMWCRVDRARFSQALVNLLSNAAKFSPSGAIVTVSVELAGDDGVRISVADTGPGIPKEFQSKIFGRFAQADSSSTRAKTGTGLGLSITKSIVEAFGGQIGFESDEGNGSVFYFILPLCAAKQTLDA